MNFFWLFIALVIFQRAVELIIAKRNELSLKELGAREVDRKGYRIIVAIHVAFFFLLIFEWTLLKRSLNPLWAVFLLIFAAAQILRYWAITSLGIYWNTKIIVAPEHPLIKSGPYKFLRHPNYVAVVTELAVVPLIFSCYLTAAVFTLLNAFVIRRRIRIETAALTHEES